MRSIIADGVVTPLVGGGGSGGAYTDGEVYSTGEVRIGTWIDGKPLYRISIVTRTPASLNVNTVIYSAAYIDTFVFWTCVLTNTGGSKNVRTGSAEVDVYNGLVRDYLTNQYFLNCPAVYTLEYTKTTDTVPDT